MAQANGPEQRPELKIALPSQETPYAGVFEEVSSEYMADPEKFGVRMRYNMEIENPILIRIFGLSIIASPCARLTDKWMSIYYEMLARSNRKQGLPPLFISDSFLFTQITLRQTEGDLIRPDEREELLEEEMRARRLRDEALSPELAQFWQSVDRDVQEEFLNGTESAVVDMSFVALFSLQDFMQRQNDEYSSKKLFN